jgi:hypothetical protein
MPRPISIATEAVADLNDLIDFCRSSRFDPTNEDGIAAAAPVLAALANNRQFLADFALTALKDHCATQSVTNSYSPQVILLHPPEDRFFLRANIWPAPADPAYRSCGPASFFYGCPHDHAFDFLTVGYLGPGYWSDYYELEEVPAGIPGETVALRFVERSQLTPGRMLLYRANRDIHDQAPPERLSVSLNVMPMSRAQAWRQQYLFDVGQKRIAHVMNVTSAELMLGLCVHFGGGNGTDLAEQFSQRHPDPRMRLAALDALDAAETCNAERQRRAQAALDNGHPLVRALAAKLMEQLQSGAMPAGISQQKQASYADDAVAVG